MYTKRCLGQPNVSCLSRCTYFRGVLNEEFHCIIIQVYVCTMYIILNLPTQLCRVCSGSSSVYQS